MWLQLLCPVSKRALQAEIDGAPAQTPGGVTIGLHIELDPGVDQHAGETRPERRGGHKERRHDRADRTDVGRAIELDLERAHDGVDEPVRQPEAEKQERDGPYGRESGDD